MARVYAADPAGAFAASSNLDQQRVSNYLNSIQQNRNVQLQNYQAATQQAAAQQAAQQAQQRQMVDLVQTVIDQRNRQQKFGLDQQALTEAIRHNRILETQPNASQNNLDWTKQIDARDQAELAKQSEAVARYMNEHAALSKLLKQVPTTPETQSAAMDQSLSGIPLNWRSFTPFIGSTRTPQAEMEVKQRIASSVPSELNPDWENAKTLPEFAATAKTALDMRLAALSKLIPSNEQALNQLVRMEGGKAVPNFLANPLLGAGASVAPRVAPVAAAPAVTSAPASAEGIREDFRNGRIDRATAVQALKALGFK